MVHGSVKGDLGRNIGVLPQQCVSILFKVESYVVPKNEPRKSIHVTDTCTNEGMLILIHVFTFIPAVNLPSATEARSSNS